MIRKPLPWVALLCLLTPLFGCTHKPPTTAPAAAAAAAPAQPGPAPAVRQAKTAPTPAPADPMLSSDMAVVNDELHRRGFTPNVFFDFDRSDLKADVRTQLQRDAELLGPYGRLDLLIEGHCDERGTAEYNLALGERRAGAVKSYLGSLGIDTQRMRTLSYGAERPVCTDHAESCWSQNRRDHLVVTSRVANGSVG